VAEVEAVFSIYQDYGPVVWLVVVLVLVISVLWLIVLQRTVSRLRRTYAALLASPDGKDVGELLSMYVEQMRLAASKADQLTKTSESLQRQVRGSVQNVGLVRFDAYKGTGGEQSFAVALLDSDGDGVVFSSLQGRAESRLYAKPVSRWDSTYTLSVEEREAIAQAHGNNVDNGSHL
jgi:hypothetical protein